MPVTLVKSKWSSGNLVFTDNSGTELLSIESDGTIDIKVADKLKLVGTAITATPAELNTVDGVPASITTAATPASGSCGVQFVFKDVAGATMAIPTAGMFYLSSIATGLDHLVATTGVAVLTNGAVTELAATHCGWLYTTTAAGLLGITITATADDYYVVFVLPNGKLLISTVCTVN